MGEENNNKPQEENNQEPEKPIVDLDEENKTQSSEPSILNKIPKHNWAITTYILAILVVLLLISSFTGGITGNAILGNSISEDEASETLVDYFNSLSGGGIEFVSVEDIGNIYEVTVLYQGQEVPLAITKDGKYVGSMNAISPSSPSGDTSSTETQTPKSDKPVVELFIWSYCPYGVQAQAPLAQVAKLLGDNAEFKIVPYYDGHGAYETQQNKIQSCMQEIAPDKYWDYAISFANDIYPKCGATRDIECDKSESIALMKSLGIDDTAVMKCVDERGDELNAEARNLAQSNGVSGSPSLIINGINVNIARNAEAYKTAICESFNKAPKECSTTLDATGAAASGNC